MFNRIIFCFFWLITLTSSVFFFVKVKDPLFVIKKSGIRGSPHVMLFMCHYGSGHKMATQGIVESLPDCTIKVVDIYAEPLRMLDPMRFLLPQLSNEHLYNNMAQHEWNRWLNVVGEIAPSALLLQKEQIENLLIESIAKEQPDILISCVPLVNSFLLSASKKLDIPLLVVTTDVDVKAFCYGLEDRQGVEDPKHFQITIPYAKAAWQEMFGSKYGAMLQHAFHYGFGYPTRRAFSQEAEASILDKIRQEYAIEKDEHVILVMMGGNTAHAAKIYAELLLGMSDQELDAITDKKIRLLCLCGDVSQKASRALMDELNQLNISKPSARVHIHACGATSQIAEIVSLPELCTVISKPGGSTVGEMIKKKVPMVYHISDVPLDWERGNMEYGESQNLGKRFKVSGKIDGNMRIELVGVLAHTFALHREIQANRRHVLEAEADFTSNLRNTVQQMLN